MLAHFNNKFYTPGIRTLLETSINSCLPCFLHNNLGIRKFKLYKRSITQTATGELLQVDLVTGLPASTEGFTVLLLLVCSASHYIVGLPLQKNASNHNKISSWQYFSHFASSPIFDMWPPTKPGCSSRFLQPTWRLVREKHPHLEKWTGVDRRGV